MEIDLTRRQLLAGVVGGGVAVGSGRAIYNVFLGYDQYTGTNLLRQDLDPLVSNGLRPSERHVATVSGYQIDQHSGTLRVYEETETAADDETTASPDPLETVDPVSDDLDETAAIDEELGLENEPLTALHEDLAALETGDVQFVYDSYPEFFSFIEANEHEPRPYTVAAVRGYRTADPALIASFTDGDPTVPKAVVEGLVDGFREHTSYDVERYVAGSVEDNVIFGTRDLRQYFESETDFEALLNDEDTGLFCNELTRRSVDALQAVPAPGQTTPVVGGFVNDRRHKHVYTILASFVRDSSGDLLVPVTFLDYTHTTLYDDLRLRRVLGEGLDAYDDRHKATVVGWYQS